MDLWNCKYCSRTIRIQQKDFHCQTARHKFKARWKKYYDLYDKLIIELDSDKELFNYTLEEYEAKEFEIINELDKMLIAGVFDNQPDDE